MRQSALARPGQAHTSPPSPCELGTAADGSLSAVIPTSPRSTDTHLHTYTHAHTPAYRHGTAGDLAGRARTYLLVLADGSGLWARAVSAGRAGPCEKDRMTQGQGQQDGDGETSDSEQWQAAQI